MRAFTPVNRDQLPSNIQNDQIYQGQISRTPQRNRFQKRQNSTAGNVELTPLMSPARLGRGFVSNFPICRMEYITTPCRPQCTTLFGENALNEKPIDYLSSMIIFEPEENNFGESSPSSQEQSSSQNDNHQKDENKVEDSEEFYTSNVEPTNSDNTFAPKRLPTEVLEDTKEKDDSSKKCICNCKKTHCLKLYCDCFREGESCGPTCQCNSCHNTDEHDGERAQIRHVLMKRNPEAFKAKIENDQHSKGCNCKKTFCLKKYCECYQAGLQCGSHCKCEQCKNGQQNTYSKYDKEERFKNTVKKERRMKEL